MKHNLQLKLSQQLTLTPQLQQSIRLLQLSTLELNHELEQMLQENPLLELEDEESRYTPGSEGGAQDAPSQPTEEPAEFKGDADSHQEDIDWNDYSARASDDDDDSGPQTPAHGPTLREYLLSQVAFIPLPERDRALVAALIDALNDNGYLCFTLDEIAETLRADKELFPDLEPEELDIALKHLQHLDPTGVGARHLGECLSLQLQALPPDTPGLAIAKNLVENHLGLLANRDVGKLKKALHIDDAELHVVRALILGLNPKPGASFSNQDIHYVVPDVSIRKVRGLWLASLNPDAMPKLRINRLYADILARNRDNGSGQLSSQLQEAKWLIKNVQQRFDTILRVSQAIVDRQRHFFEHGEVAMRPLVLREIAEAVGMHESTISRVTTQKYMMTPRGLYELKYFFGSHVATEAGGTASSTAIRALIKQLVSAENPQRPLSDGQISELLGQQGIVVARRTVAKYREALQISPANMRRSV
ncbi:MAG TPA: RNA polymerase factor sigma-54 [Thiobacillaceae bacterium]|nr:RNA polymerase factor sigma-54 [Thiobacillaceae bacterium]